MTAREEFAAQFSERRFSDVEGLPTVADAHQNLLDVLKVLGFVVSNGDARRAAEQKSIRLVAESSGGGSQQETIVSPGELRAPLAGLLAAKLDSGAGGYYLKLGRKLARVAPPS